MKQFRLTYQTVTAESAEYGDFAHHGFVSRTGNYNPDRNYMPDKPAQFKLRDALRIFEAHGGSVQANECPVTCPRWLDSCQDDCEHSVTLGLHFPEHLTASTRVRIARYVGCYGVKS